MEQMRCPAHFMYTQEERTYGYANRLIDLFN